MDVIEGLDHLRRATERLGSSELPLRFETAPEVVVSEVAEVLSLSPDLVLAYEHGAPSGEFPCFVQRSELFHVAELKARQVGWAVSADGEADPEWSPSWIVIGHEEGDPFIAHVDRQGTPVSVALHGTGTWSPSPIAGSLGSFYAFIAAWSTLIIEDFDGEKLDEDRDFEVKDGFWSALQRKLAPVLAEHEIAAFREYLAT